jgi:hypothetical protein
MSKTNAPVAKILIDLDEYLQLLKLKETVKNQEEEITKHYVNSKVNENDDATTKEAEEKFGQGEQPLSETQSVSQPLQSTNFDSAQLTSFFCQFLKDNYNLTPKSSSGTSNGAIAQSGAGSDDLIPNITPALTTPDPIAAEEEYQFRRPVESVVIQKSRQSDNVFDKGLLESVPPAFLQRAEKLLKALSDNVNELSWDKQGVIFIDQKSLPDSDIKSLFPKLFRKVSHPDKIMYLNEVSSKIASLGLGSLINRRLTAGLSRTKPVLNQNELREKIVGLKNWWYIGD